MAQNNDFILELMLENGMVTDEQVSEGWQKVAESEGSLNIIQALENLKYVDPGELLQMLAQQYGMETLDLSTYKIPQEVIDSVPKDVVEQYHIIPVMKHDEVLTIAIGDPTDLTTLDSVRYVLKCDVDAVVAPQEQIQNAIKTYYSDLGQGVDSAIAEIKDMDTGELTPANPDEGGAVNADESGEGDAPIIRLVTAIIVEAYKMHASDIHMEPLEKRYRIRYRVDGVLREVDAPPKYLQPNITSRVKIMSRLDISEKRLPQDGRIQMRVSGCDIDLRVSTIPTTHGESIVMRILEKASIQLEIPQLGFYADDQKKINQIINMPDGVFLVTGPTGSGKTTSLYAFLNTDGFGKDDQSVCVSEYDQPAEPEDHHGGGPGGISAAGHQSGAGEQSGGHDVRQCAARDAASGAEHHHGGRDPRRGNGDHRHQRGPDGTPGVQHAAHQRRTQCGDPYDRYGRPAVPGVFIRACHHGPASAAPGLQKLCRTDDSHERGDASAETRRPVHGYGDAEERAWLPGLRRHRLQGTCRNL